MEWWGWGVRDTSINVPNLTAPPLRVLLFNAPIPVPPMVLRRLGHSGPTA